MTINHGATFICSSNVALGRVGPQGIVLDGQTLIDVAQFVNALYVTVYGRARGPRELSFTVWAFFATEALALACFLTQENTLALKADLTIADDAASVTFTMADAVGQCRAAQIQGVAVRLEYKFTGAKFA